MRLVLVLSILMMGQVVLANTAPTVTQVSASPRTDDSGYVDISYKLTDADNDRCTITVQVSNDGGSTWTITPSASALSGALTNVYPGNRSITWASKVDLPGTFGSNYKVKVTADDGPDITWVYIDDPGVPGHEPYKGCMSKYETTNAQYCEFLNSAMNDSLITVYNNVVYATNDTGHSQPYYDLAGGGYTYNGATNGGATRINWTGSSFTVDSGFENHPVTYVSWYGANAFCDYYGYRLPTEWEWQAVADHTIEDPYTYGCGTTITNSKANYYGTSHPYGTTGVGAFGTYGYGVCDIAGNVWEWTSTFYTDGIRRRNCSGSWVHNSSWCLVNSGKINSWPDSLLSDYGFRVCRGDIESGLVAHYKLDDTSGPVLDETGNHDGTNYGATRGVTGKVGNAFKFDGNDRVDLPKLGISGSMPRTVSMWAKNGTKTSPETLIGWSPLSHAARQNFIINTNEIFVGDLYINFSSKDFYTAGGLISTSDFTFITVVYDGGILSTSTVHAYINAVEKSLTQVGSSSGAAITVDDNYKIGVNAIEATMGYDGIIDEVRIYNRVLSASEIQYLYQNP